MKKYLPIFFNISKRKILIIGGGNVAAQKVVMSQKFTNNITVLSREFGSKVKAAGIKLKKHSYHKKHLKGYSIVYACTNNKRLNVKIKKEANEKNIMVNVVDDKELCDFITPAVYNQGKMTVAVSSHGTNCLKTIALRDKIKDFLRNKPKSKVKRR